MKIINIKLFISALLILGATSCSEDKLPLYEDVDRIYFYWIDPDTHDSQVNNNVMVSLGYDDPVKSDSIIRIKVCTMGHISDVDRPVTAEVIRAESTAKPGEDIEILPSYILAGETRGELLVKVKNSEKLETTTLMAWIRLTPNEYFHVDWNANNSDKDNNTSCLEYIIKFDAKTEIPNLWKDNPMKMNTWFGTWSREKELAIYEALGVDRSFFTYDPAVESASVALGRVIPDDMAVGMIAIVNRFLEAYKVANDGKPLMDENGLEVKISNMAK